MLCCAVLCCSGTTTTTCTCAGARVRGWVAASSYPAAPIALTLTSHSVGQSVSRYQCHLYTRPLHATAPVRQASSQALARLHHATLPPYPANHAASHSHSRHQPRVLGRQQHAAPLGKLTRVCAVEWCVAMWQRSRTEPPGTKPRQSLPRCAVHARLAAVPPSVGVGVRRSGCATQQLPIVLLTVTNRTRRLLWQLFLFFCIVGCV